MVASATLAILLVCFSIYQYSQLDPTAKTAVARSRMPITPTQSALSTNSSDPADSQGVQVGDAYLGGGRGIKLTLYPSKGKRARLEIAVRKYAPIEGAGNEFSLDDPEVRMRTNDGRAVRLTAQRGVMEADRRAGGSLDLRRGRLIGDVVIEIDRLTEEERAALSASADQPVAIDPAQLVRVELDEIEFDLEYYKVLVPPGPFHLQASDMEFRTRDLEVRFNEEEGRIDYLRINDGGKFVLREVDEGLGLSIPNFSAKPETHARLTDWLRAALIATLEAQQPPKPAQETPKPEESLTEADDGTPVFAPDSHEEEKAKPPVRYFARFEGNVDARQVMAGTTRTRLTADVLEILRAFSAEDKQRVRSRSQAGPRPGPGEPEASPPREEITLEWSGRLVLEAVTPENDRWSEEVPSKITASGSPVEISSPQWNASCATLTFDPNGSKVWLNGAEEGPVVVRSAEQGLMTGREVYTQRSGDALLVRVAGPGRLVRDMEPASADLDEEPAGVIEFDERLELHGRFVTSRRLGFTGMVSYRESRVFDRAEFRGQVTMREDDTGLQADAIDITFGEATGRRDDRQSIERVEGRGHVVMTQGDDRLTSREIDLLLTTDRDGRAVPLTATAKGDVEAIQQERTIRAREMLTVDFEMVSRPAPPFDPAKAHAKARAEGLDPTQIDWEARRRHHEARIRTEIGIKRLEALGDVVIVDPGQGLDLKAEHVECTLVDGKEIQTAVVIGEADHPASVQLNNFTVSGGEIRINVPDEWAEVPGAGRMTFRSRKDLDGRKVKEPIPISITWEDRLDYQGRENRAVFIGSVHATSAATTVDCRQLLIEFDEIASLPADDARSPDWWIFQDLIDRVARQDDTGGAIAVSQVRFSKEPAYFLATGKATVETSELDETTQALKSRARLSGPKLSVNLRAEVSKMLIEGGGLLLLEDFRPTSGQGDGPGPRQEQKGLFSIDENAGPSKTLIEWDEFMWYDFSIKLARFEGDVNLKHFSGAALERVFGRVAGGSADLPEGRSTFLTCDVLTADFHDRGERQPRSKDRRMGGLSADRLRQFQASGEVELQDSTAGLFVAADRLTYERNREILTILGALGRPFRLTLQRPNEPPKMASGEYVIYNIATRQIESLRGSKFEGR